MCLQTPHCTYLINTQKTPKQFQNTNTTPHHLEDNYSSVMSDVWKALCEPQIAIEFFGHMIHCHVPSIIYARIARFPTINFKVIVGTIPLAAHP